MFLTQVQVFLLSPEAFPQQKGQFRNFLNQFLLSRSNWSFAHSTHPLSTHTLSKSSKKRIKKGRFIWLKINTKKYFVMSVNPVPCYSLVKTVNLCVNLPKVLTSQNFLEKQFPPWRQITWPATISLLHSSWLKAWLRFSFNITCSAASHWPEYWCDHRVFFILLFDFRRMASFRNFHLALYRKCNFPSVLGTF